MRSCCLATGLRHLSPEGPAGTQEGWWDLHCGTSASLRSQGTPPSEPDTSAKPPTLTLCQHSWNLVSSY